MPKKGGKKKKELQEVPSRVPDEVQAIPSIAQPASGIGTQAQSPQGASTQAQAGPRKHGEPPSQGQQSGQQQASRPEQSLRQAPSVPQQQNQAPAEKEWVLVGQGRASQAQGRGSALGRGETLGLGSGRGQSPRPGPQHQPTLQGAQGGRGGNVGLGSGRGQSPRPGQPQQHPMQGTQGGRGGNVGLGSGRGQSPRPGQPPMQNAWGGQRPAEQRSAGQSQQYVQASKPSYSQPSVQATPQVPGQRQLVQTQQPAPPAWGQPRSQTVSLPKVPQTLESVPKQVVGVEKVTEAVSEVSLQKNQSTSQLSAITGQKKIPIDVSNMPKRPDFNKAGTLGRKISVLTNMMQIIFGENFVPDVKHYDVQIEPDKPKYLMRAVFKKAQEILFSNRQPAFDGKKNAYAAGFLPFGEEASVEVTVDNENQREKKFKVTLKKVADLNLTWLQNFGPGPNPEKSQECIQALDIILRMAPVLKATPVGRSFFMRQDEPLPLGGGLDCWVGLFQSAVLGWKPFLNVDVAHKGFPKPQPVLDLIKTICGCDGQGGGGGRPQGRQQGYGSVYNPGPTELTDELINKYKEDINRFLKGLKVVYQIPQDKNSKRVQRVNELVACPRYNSFEHNGYKVSVEQYFLLQKKYKIQYPLFPCLWVGGRDRNIHVPLELCTIVEGQATQKKLDDKQTSEMIRHAATGTKDRQKKIMDSVKKMDYNNDPCMEEFGISVSGQFAEIPARVLDAPALAYKQKIVNVTKGQWTADVFLESTSLISDDNSWTIVNLNYRTKVEELHNFADQLRERAGGLGVKIGKAASPFVNLDTRRNVLRELLNYFDSQKNKRKLVIAIIPDDKGSYSWVKQASELSIGILTQCVKGKTLSKIEKERNYGKNATLTNILLKINAKLNGVNHKIAPQQKHCLPYCLRAPCMIVGADVTHPSPDSKDIPSIAAVVASHDPRAFRYNTEIRLQPPKEEIILELAEIMITQLKFFFDKTGYWPRRIIYYRDGVGEGYFNKVLQHELGAIRKACKVIEAEIKVTYEPPTTFIVVQKRHHTRLFPTSPKNSDDAQKHYNVQAGTIVDTEITHPSDVDFYLVSHASIQGTARPTKYRCLWDDSDTSEDEIEQLTYYLCHMFTRCTRSVSYPAPTYYAHLAAFRARALTYGVPIDLNNLAQAQRKQLDLKKEVSKGTPMFFV